MTSKNLQVMSLLLLLVPLLNGCEDGGKGIIFAIVAAGAASALHNSMDDDDDNQNQDSSTTDSSSSSDGKAVKIHSVQEYDGINDDLLTAGVGQSGLTNSAPTATDPENPSAAEIRKATIINQYQALLDMRSASGYGSLYGPAVGTTNDDGKVAGKEYLAYADDGSGHKNVTMMVQVPNSFNREQPCIIVAPSPGSRGVYAGIVTVGEWGLKNHCAVAYTDKGTGNGVHDLNTDTVNLIDGTRDTATNADKQANFRAQGTSQLDLAAYSSTYPARIAQKHAHSQQNPEADWGNNVLDAIRFAFDILNTQEQSTETATTNDNNDSNNNENPEPSTQITLTPANTLVIASGISSGGAASLRATEQDKQNWIDGVVVAAPLINPRGFSDNAEGITIQQGTNTFFYHLFRKSLFDVITYYNVFQPCASANTSGGLPGRCISLVNAGWLNSNLLLEQIAEAQRRLNNYGTLETSNVIAQLYETANIYASFANLYANAYGSFSVVDNLCGYSYAGSDGDEPPSAKSLADLADDFQSSHGIPPSSGTYLINNHGNEGDDNEGDGINFRHSVDVNGNLDGYLQGALCLRQLATGTTGVTIDTGTPLTRNPGLTETALEHYQRVQAGIDKVLASGNLQGKPAIIVQGRDDALAHVNFSARAYYGLNQKTKLNSKLVYIEVKHAHHIDGLNEQYNITNQVPLHYYLNQALDQMYKHLKDNTTLPTSQVIPTEPLKSTDKRLPDIGSKNTCEITFSNDVLTIPECEPEEED